MCNLYSITTNQAAIIALFRVVNRYVGNLAPMPGVFPDYPAPVILNTDNGTELAMMRWGMPPPPRNGLASQLQTYLSKTSEGCRAEASCAKADNSFLGFAWLSHARQTERTRRKLESAGSRSPRPDDRLRESEDGPCPPIVLQPL